jgi:hypothetical protein
MNDAQDLVRLVILFHLRDKGKDTLRVYNDIVNTLQGRREVASDETTRLAMNISQYINFIANNYKVPAEDIINDLTVLNPEEIEINESVSESCEA